MNFTEVRNTLNDLDDITLSALLIYGEARGEPPLGQIAVLHVAINRAAIGGWYGRGLTGELGVILKPFQFSCFNENDPNLPKLAGLLKAPNDKFHRCLGVAQTVLRCNTPDPTRGALNYHTIAKPSSVKTWPPKWAGEMVETVRIGAHVFYRAKVK